MPAKPGFLVGGQRAGDFDDAIQVAGAGKVRPGVEVRRSFDVAPTVAEIVRHGRESDRPKSRDVEVLHRSSPQ
jgi:hypothetical protein